MEEKKTVFDYLGRVVFTFGFTMMCMMCFVVLFGDLAKEYSAFFELGPQGLPVKVMAQFLGLSVIVEGIRILFFTEGMIKKIGILPRMICMLISIVLAITLFAVLFDWFPINMWQPWCMFLLCFGLCFAGSLAVVSLKNRMENRRLAEGLSKIKAELEEK